MVIHELRLWCHTLQRFLMSLLSDNEYFCWHWNRYKCFVLDDHNYHVSMFVLSHVIRLHLGAIQDISYLENTLYNTKGHQRKTKNGHLYITFSIQPIFGPIMAIMEWSLNWFSTYMPNFSRTKIVAIVYGGELFISVITIHPKYALIQ